MSDSKRPQAMPAGAEREQQIYALGLSGGKPCVPVPLNLLEQKAKEILVPRAYDYVAGGAGGEDTMRANREAFYRWRIVPRMLRDVSKRDLSVGLLAETPEQNPAAAIQLWGSLFSNAALTWKDIAFLRQHTRVPIILKGILHANDAARAQDAGVDALIVSRSE